MAVEAMETIGLHLSRVCIRRQHTTIAEGVVCCPINEMCTEAERMPGTSRMVRWWDQDAVNKPEE